MKLHSFLGYLAVGLSALTAVAQVGKIPSSEQRDSTPYAVVERGADHRVWERTVYERAPDGTMVPRVHRYAELATGMHYQKEGHWVDSKEEIMLLSNGRGAVAEQGRHKVLFPANLHEGAVELNTPDAKWLRSRVLGLSYYDTASGQSVLIAELKDTVGALHKPNKVVYADAFDDLKADIRYTYSKAGFEQDIILREQPPSPKEYGLNPETTRLQVLTEFFDAPDMKREARQAAEAYDETLEYGGMRMGRGKAFALDAKTPALHGVRVDKSWNRLEGRDFLVEEVEFRKAAEQIRQLPLMASLGVPSSRSLHASPGNMPALPAPRLVRQTTNSFRMAKADTLTQPGFVLDYVQIDSGQSNYTFTGDTTYYITGQYSLDGVTTLEGGAVLKFAATGELVVNGTLDCQTGPYRPAVFTSENDNSVGEPLGSGTPAAGDVTQMLTLNNATDLKYVRFAYAATALSEENGSVWHSQFVDCSTCGIAEHGAATTLHNVLFARCGAAILSSAAFGVHGEQLTVDSCGAFASTNATGGVTNMIYSACTNALGSLATNQVLITNSSAIYQAAVGGYYYLPTNSPCHGGGTTNISPELLAALQAKTTWPPVVFSNATISASTNFLPQAVRDTNAAPDLGYHYDPIDYAFGGVLSLADLTFGPGTVAAWFPSVLETESYNYPWGIHEEDTNTVIFDGRIDAPCYWVRCNTVQEADGSYNNGMVGITGRTQDVTTDAAQVSASFTTFSVLGGLWTSHFRDDWGRVRLAATHCEFWSGGIGQYASSLQLTNSLLHRMTVYSLGNYELVLSLTMRNCTMIGGQLYVEHWWGPIDWYSDWYSQDWELKHWTSSIRNTTFDQTSISTDDPGFAEAADYDYNAFLDGANVTVVDGGHSLTTIASFNWQTSYLGDYYLPTNSPLINAGSTTADLAGLYAYTTQTNQVEEANSQVDIGYHYVALDANGNPVDTDGDVLTDLREIELGTNPNNADSDGDGIPDGWEVDHGMNPLSPADVSADTNNVIRLQIYTPLR